MNSTRWLFVGLMTAFYLGYTLSPTLATEPKLPTIEQQQKKLMQDINAGQKSGKLTAQQSNKLRKTLADVARQKKRMQKKNNGKLTPDDTVKLQSSIDKASIKIKQEQDVR